MSNLELRLRSDATRLPVDSPVLLLHILSDEFLWGLGFTQSIEARWPQATRGVQQTLRTEASRARLGEVLWTPLAGSLVLGHLLAERSRGLAQAELQLDAFASCLRHVASAAGATGAVVHAPPLGTGLACARWSDVRALLESELVQRGIPVVIHCLGSQGPS